MIHSLSNDVEVKAAVAIMYATILFLVISPMLAPIVSNEGLLLATNSGSYDELRASTQIGTPAPEFNWAWIVLIAVPLLLLLRVKKRY
jgi:hypothetical protein